MSQKRVLTALVAMLSFCAGLLSLRPATEAQTFYGTIAGSVADANGAVIPNARVTATNLGTNEAHSITTNAAGEYRISSLVPAVYKVEITAPNFKNFVEERVTVLVDSTTTLNGRLEVGSTTESVVVNSQTPLLQTDSGGVGSEVEGKFVQQIPLNGRNSMNLLALVPGVVPQQSTSGSAANNASIHTYVNGWGNYSIGGGVANESATFIDGAPNNQLGGNPPALVMTQDMVQEFKVESGAVSAEFGRFGGGVVNMTSKSGSNAFHGTVYEYFRNTVLNTNDFISNANGAPKSPFHQNQYGVAVGGPIKRDKAFFMFSWEDFRLHKASGNELVVPTMAMRGEDPAYPGGAVVNHPIFDNSSKACPVKNYGDPGAPNFLTAGQGFIPSSCFDSAAEVMRGFYAYPNITPKSNGGYNYFDQPVTGDNNHQYNVRVDYNLTNNQRIFGRYTLWHLQDIGQDDFHGHPGNTIVSDYGATGNNTNNIVLGDTISFNPTTIADVRLSWMRDTFTNYGSAHGTFDVTQLGGNWGAIAPQMTDKETPIFLAPGPDNISAPWNIPVGANQTDVTETFALGASVSKTAGAHNFKFGGSTALRNHSGIGNYAWYAGEATFLNFINGDEWASFMMGEFFSNEIHTQQNSFSIDWSHSLYATDTWRVTPKLTLNLGLRWEYPGGIYEKKNRATVFLPNVIDPTSGSDAPGALPTRIPGTLALTDSSLYPSRDFSPVKWDLFAPRFSFAYSVTPTLVTRGGFGLSFIPPDMPIGLMAFNSPVNAANTTCTNNPGNPTIFWNDPYTCNGDKLIQPPGRTIPYPSSTFYNQEVSSPVPTSNYPYMYQWNLALSRQWPGQILTDITYAGARGVRLPSSGVQTGTGGSFVSIDQLSPSYYSMGYAALSATAPCAALGGQVATVGKCLSPFPQYTGVFDTGHNTGNQNYNAMYLVFTKRFNNGGIISANYTWSHTLGDTDQPGFGNGGSVQNFYNPKGEYAVSSFDVKNRIIISYVLDLPFGKGEPYLSTGGVAAAILGGWQVNGITTLQSGFPYSFTYESANTNLFIPFSASSPSNSWGGGIARPDILPNCNLKTPGSYLHKYLTSSFFNSACLVPAGTNSPTATQNDQQLMRFGNAPRNTDAVRSQFVNNFDFSASKNFPIGERFNLLFRGEFFNLFNHPVFANANSDLGGTAYDQPNDTNPPLVNTQRLVQLSLRLSF